MRKKGRQRERRLSCSLTGTAENSGRKNNNNNETIPHLSLWISTSLPLKLVIQRDSGGFMNKVFFHGAAWPPPSLSHIQIMTGNMFTTSAAHAKVWNSYLCQTEIHEVPWRLNTHHCSWLFLTKKCGLSSLFVHGCIKPLSGDGYLDEADINSGGRQGKTPERKCRGKV